MERINNFVENFSNGIYWVLIVIIVALIITTAVLFLYALLVKGMNEHKHATAVRYAFATCMTGGLLSLIAIVFFASSQSGISMTFVRLFFVIFFFSSLIAAFEMFGAKTKKSDSDAMKKNIPEIQKKIVSAIKKNGNDTDYSLCMEMGVKGEINMHQTIQKPLRVSFKTKVLAVAFHEGPNDRLTFNYLVKERGKDERWTLLGEPLKFKESTFHMKRILKRIESVKRFRQ